MAEWIAAPHVFDGEAVRPLALAIKDGRVVDVAPNRADVRQVGGIITPGYLDLQVNGGGGVLVNTAPDRMDAILTAHRQFGTVGLMPTVITDAPEAMIAATDAALAHKAHILGLHIEGPHIAPSRRGTHAARHIRPLDDTTRQCVARLRAAGIPVMLTLAPEMVALPDIAAMAEQGVIVSLGHSDATAEQASAAFNAGALAVTHLFNAMSPMSHRAAGLAGAAMDRAPFVGLIADGIHVEDAVLGIAMRATRGRVFLVSDAMPTVGGPDVFDLYDMTIRVQDGRLVNTEGALAGAHTTMAEGVARLVRLGIPVAQALKCAITHPAALIGRPDLAGLIGRRTDDLLVLGPDMMPTGERL